MSPGVGYALMSLLAAGMLDVVFGRYSGSRPVTGTYLFVIGGVVIAGQAAVLAIARVPFSFDGGAAAWGVSAGAVLLLANALLIESLGRINVSLGSTIYRLNTIAVVLFAVVFLHESLTVAKASGIALGIVAVVLLYQRGGRGDTGELLHAALWIAVTASLLRAAFGVMSKAGLLEGVDPFLFLVYVGIGWTLAALAFGVARRRRGMHARSALKYGLICGTLVCMVASFLLLGLRSGEASVVIPIANMSFVVALLTSAALGMERLTRRKLLAVGCAGVAITLLTGA